jgi:hypothetical protein
MYGPSSSIHLSEENPKLTGAAALQATPMQFNKEILDV